MTNKTFKFLGWICSVFLLILSITFITKEVPKERINNVSTNASSASKIHFIDVGQGDSILIEADKHYMLIDAGENNQGDIVVNYLKEVGIKKLDYVIGTHPHSDHIGGLDDVIRSFDIGKVIMPDVTHTTKTFEDVLDAIAENGLKITKAAAGNTYSLGESSFTILAPNASEYEELNNYSVVIKFTNGENSFLLTGDAEELSETQMLNNDVDLSADVLKLGHHGSSTSSHEDFLDEVDPDYAVISAGDGNSYGHPHVETLQKLKDRNIKVFRTDLQNTIIFTSDGENITVNKEPYSITPSDLSGKVKESSKAASKEKSTGSTMVHITSTGRKYHAAGCRFLKVDIEITLEEALSKGLEPCGTCNPPTK